MRIERGRGSPDTLQATAAQWLVRIQNDELSAEQIAEWQQWLASSEAHRAAFERMQQLWQGLELLPDKTPPPVPFVARLRGRPAWLAMAATVLIAVALLGMAHLWRSGGLHLSGGAIAFKTEVREHREVRLQDGSQLVLGGESLALVRFGDAEREVKLDRGEAFFEIAKDARRPFVVHVGEATITAVGTAFNVRKSGERVHVVVTEGSVTVQHRQHTGDATVVSAGHQVALEPSHELREVQPAAPDSATAWRSGRLEYLGEPLKYVVADVNRYSNRQIAIGEPAVGELLVTGTVFEDDIDAWLRSVEVLLPVTVDRVDAGRIVLNAR